MEEHFKTIAAYAVVGTVGFFVGASVMARFDKREVLKNNTRVYVVTEFLNWLNDAMDEMEPDELIPLYVEKLKFMNIALEET
jgi:hypothetical protein